MLFLIVLFLFINFFIFFGYRLFFLEKFTQNISLLESLPVLVSGLRLDTALLFFELFLMACLVILRGKCFLRFCFLYLWTLTFLHICFSFANIAFFQERNQTLGESFIAYITSPYEIYIGTAPFIKNNWGLILFFLAVSALFFYMGILVSRKLFVMEATVWRSPKNFAIVVGLGLLCLLPNIEPVTVKKSKSAKGWKLTFTHSKYYTQYENFIFNQAIPNPWYDLFRVHIPLLFARSHPFRLQKDKAMQVCLESLDHKPYSTEYPLLRKIQSDFSFGLENVVLIQVEGLSQVLLDWQHEGKDIMPCLKRLSQEGIYFPHVFQSFNATSGAFFSTATSFHKACFEEKTRTFSTPELNGYYGCLSQILGSHTHYFAQGFRQNANEFLTFMGNQGYTNYSYHDFQRILEQKNRIQEAEDLLGIFDSYFFQECAEILEKCPGKFTAHFITATSHSPWGVPKNFSSPFQHPAFNAFYYVDKSIEQFLAKMSQNPERFQRTLFVIVADHASISRGDDFLERIRIPLVLYNPQFTRLPDKERFHKIYASQVDILPTVLDILGGEREYSGLGESLFRERAKIKGVLGGARDYGFYIKDNLFFQYVPSQKQTFLFKIENDTILLKDISSEYPEKKARMELEYFAQTETSQRLILEKRIFPWKKQENKK